MITVNGKDEEYRYLPYPKYENGRIFQNEEEYLRFQKKVGKDNDKTKRKSKHRKV